MLQSQRSKPLPQPYKNHSSRPLMEVNHYMMGMRKKPRRSRERKATVSLCSIDYKPSFNRLPLGQQVRRRKIQSIPFIDVKNLDGERGEVLSKYTEPIRPSRSSRPERMRTLQPRIQQMQDRQQKIKNCIQIMRGVLQQIKVTKQSKKQPTKIKKQHQSSQMQIKLAPTKQNKSSNLQQYIHNHANMHNKPLLIKRGKSNSVINIINRGENQLRYKIPPKGPSIRETQNKTVSERETFNNEQSCQKKVCYQPKISQIKQTIESFDCSSIHKINQSSFISGDQKKELMLQLSQEVNTSVVKLSVDKGKKKMKLSNKKIKQIFPMDFF